MLHAYDGDGWFPIESAPDGSVQLFSPSTKEGGTTWDQRRPAAQRRRLARRPRQARAGALAPAPAAATRRRAGGTLPGAIILVLQTLQLWPMLRHRNLLNRIWGNAGINLR